MYKEMQKHLFEMLEVMDNVGYSKSKVDNYRNHILGLIEYLNEYKLELSVKSISDYSEWLKKVSLLSDFTIVEKSRAANRFLTFCETGNYTIFMPIRRHRFYGEFSEMMNAFIDSLYDLNLKNVTISQYCRRLRQLDEYLMVNGNSKITGKVIVEFFEYFSLQNVSSYAFYDCSTIIRKFTQFIYENHYLTEDISPFVPRGRYIRNQTLPSVYTDEEIKVLLKCINRNCVTGKRDYAMVIMLVCYGLRSLDIVSLKFSDIDWDNSVINLTMAKTGTDIQLPLFPDVGNAIIDWLRNGYRKSDLPFVFQTIKGPIRPLTSSALYSVVNKYLLKAGINTSNRHHGTHALRHSLATRLMEQGESLPVISEVLGHGDTQVTTVYTSININSAGSSTDVKDIFGGLEWFIG